MLQRIGHRQHAVALQHVGLRILRVSLGNHTVHALVLVLDVVYAQLCFQRVVSQEFVVCIGIPR